MVHYPLYIRLLGTKDRYMSYWQEKLKIGNLSFPRFIGGPLDGITDSPFRQLVRDFSKDELLYTEMRHVGCIASPRGGQKALKFAQVERPLNYQVAANKVDLIDQACEKIIEAGVDCVDLNVGCPARNVIGSGSGSALMADLPRLKAILDRFRTNLSIPFTVKIRSGFKEENALEVAKLVQDCGADALAIHPRLQTQRFDGRPDYTIAARVKQAIDIPLIISGGVVNFKTAKMVYEQTGVDGFLIGRGIWARPWKLKEMHEHSLGNEFRIDNAILLKCAIKHLEIMIDYYGPHGLHVFRKHMPFYIKGQPSAGALRKQLMVSNSVEEVKKGLNDFLG